MKRIVILLINLCIGSAAVLLTNGDFEQNLNVGWMEVVQGQETGDTIDRNVSFHPDPDFEVRVKKYDAAYARLYQTVDIATTDLEFSVDAKLVAYEYTPGDIRWATASIVLEYRNDQDSALGQTRICYNSPHCPYTNTATFHMIEAIDTTNWHTYAFNVDDELVNLPGVYPPDIARIEVSLYDTTDGC